MKRGKMTKDAATKGTSSKDVGAVVNAIQILRHLAHADGPQGVAAIARATGISPSSAFNILRTLSNERLTSFDVAGKTYQLGLGLSELAVGFVGRSYADLIQPELERLSLAHHILIALWQVTDDAHIASSPLPRRPSPTSASPSARACRNWSAPPGVALPACANCRRTNCAAD